MITIKDVAQHADVSIATVSRVVNGSGPVSETLRQRVKGSIAALGYEPDFLARSWRTRSTRMIAAVVSDNTAPQNATLVREAGAVALDHDYNLILVNTYRDPAIERDCLRMLRLRSIDGVLVNTLGQCDDEIRKLAARGVPVVLVNRPLYLQDACIDAIVVDSYRGSYQLVEHLIGMGHRRIGLICGPLAQFHGYERLRGYRDALAAHGLANDEALVRFGNFEEEASARATEELLALSPRPTALFAAGYDSGLATMRVLRSHRLHIPEDIAFVMYDNVTWGEFVDPPLTLAENPARELGRLAIELVLARLADRQRPPQEVWLQPRLVVRQSCGAQ